MSDGWKEKELAAKLGQPQSWVSEQLKNLRDAIHLQQGIFPPLSEAEVSALTDSIREHGVLEPVHVNYDTASQRLTILDGNHRTRIAADVERSDTIRYILHTDLYPLEISGLEYTLNATRRQIDTRTKKKLAEEQLKLDATRSDRLIASICGIHHETVGQIRKDLAAQWDLHNAPYDDDDIPPNDLDWPNAETQESLSETATQTPGNSAQTVNPYQPTTRTGQDGRPQTSTPDRIPTPEREWTLGPITCPTCGTQHTLIRVGERHTLRA